MSDDKTEEPTHKKIEDAKKKGQIALSRDLARLATLVVVAEIAFATLALWRDAVFNLMHSAIGHGGGADFRLAAGQILGSAGLLLLVVFCCFFVVCIVVGVTAHWGQFGILIATESITPKFDKLNPVNGAKQLFSKKKLIELLVTVGKALLIGWIVYNLIRSHLPEIIALAGGTPEGAFDAFVGVLRSMFHVIVVACLCLGMMDFAVQKYFHKKDLMMDKEEIKRENKESEGDPMIKGKRKQLARQWASEAPAAKTEGANAVVVNPTHFAVAMFYDPQEAMVPLVLARGKDEVAQAMIQRARERGIPVIRHVWLARTLYATCQDDMVVPKASYEAVAQVYAVVHQLAASGQVGMEVELESLGVQPSGRLQEQP